MKILWSNVVTILLTSLAVQTIVLYCTHSFVAEAVAAFLVGLTFGICNFNVIDEE